MSPPVSAEARGQLRLLWIELERQADRMTRAIGLVPEKVLDSTNWKGKVGAQRAIAKIVRAMPVAPELSVPEKAVWRFLQPVERLPAADAEEPPRSGFVMMGIIAGNKNRLTRAETFGIGFTLHAVGRMLDRSRFHADPVKAMLEAHNALTWLEPEEGSRIFDLQDAQFPAARGAFLATPGRFGPFAAPLAIARTWVGNDQFFPDQDGLAAAWHDVVAGGT